MGSSSDDSIAVSFAYMVNIVRFELGMTEVKILLNKSQEISLLEGY